MRLLREICRRSACMDLQEFQSPTASTSSLDPLTVTDGPACGTSTLHLKILDKQSHAAHQCRLRWTIVHEWSYKPSTTFWIRFHRHAFMHALRRQQAGVTNQATQQGRILSSFATGPCIARAPEFRHPQARPPHRVRVYIPLFKSYHSRTKPQVLTRTSPVVVLLRIITRIRQS